jgi:adenine-specific DNA-methyltransferase
MEPLDKDTDGSSLNIVESNIEQLKALFPDTVSEGKIDFDKLRETLGDAVETQEERYNFSWNGKALAKRIAQTQSTGTLRPCKAESKHWDSTQNLFIEGDNLEVLKLLQKSYHKQVKMIYIDPPYNTGKEFIYPDNYKDNLDTYLQYTHQKDEDGRKFGTNADTSGRYHTNWLNMMYPRLKLARNLLRDDGVIFISIDDNEVTNLRKLCDEIFGEDNFVADLIWEKRFTRNNDAKLMSFVTDHIIFYRKSGALKNLREPRTEKSDSIYKNPDNDPRGNWTSVSYISQRTKAERKNLSYSIHNPKTSEEITHPVNAWKYSYEQYLIHTEENRLHWGKDCENQYPRLKRFLLELNDGIVPVNFWSYKETGTSDDGTKELSNLIGKDVFDYPKPTSLIRRMMAMTCDSYSIVLDFFSGSATTAHAVMALNAKDNGNRKFITVQLPEPCDKKTEAYKAGYKTIADIGKERIRRAGEKILEEVDKEGIENLDIGFKVFKLDSSNIKPWDADFDNLEDTLLNIVDNIKEDRGEDDVLTEILLKYGLDLTVPIEERQVSGKAVYIIGFGALVVCLADAITLEVVEGIGHLKAELAPEVMRVVFKDSGFKDDVVKTNAIQILKQYDIDDVKSL